MMIPHFRWLSLLLCCLASAGCCLDECKLEFCDDGCYDESLVEQYGGAGLQPEDPYLSDCIHEPWVEPIAPSALGNENVKYSEAFKDIQYTQLTLEECIHRALENSQVMRDLGGTLLRNPGGQTTVFDPSIVYADPRVGEEAALSAFDANLFASAFFDYNDRVYNNTFFGNQGLLVQELGDYRWGISKQTASGTTFTFRNVINRENNNQLGNQFGTPSSSYDVYVEAEARQPLLQGAGVLFNRIAGTSGEIGVYNGVLIARANTDISLAQFEQGIRDLVSNVENAYWDLYFAYRDLDAKIDARDSALETWRVVQRKRATEGGRDDELGQAKEQFFRFEAEVIDALYGRLVDGTRTNNGSSSGTFRSSGGVRVAERRLRLIMGTTINDGALIRPYDEPFTAAVRFDWNQSTNQAVLLRPELRAQRWRVKQRELELIASKNYLLPRLDAVGRYRMRGFGDELWSSAGDYNAGGQGVPRDASASAVTDMFGGERQEWQLGVELTMPFGFRREHAAVRNAELQLTRDQAILREQEREVMYGLSNAVDELHRAYESMRAQYNRLASATFQLEAVQEAFDLDRTTLDVVLEAQRRVVDAEIRFYQSQIEYMLGIKAVHYEKGTLLDYANVALTESLWPAKAYRDAANRDCLRGENLDYVCRDLVISNGPHGATTMSFMPTQMPAVGEQNGFGDQMGLPVMTPQPPASARNPNEAGQDWLGDAYFEGGDARSTEVPGVHVSSLVDPAGFFSHASMDQSMNASTVVPASPTVAPAASTDRNDGGTFMSLSDD